jgi:hypothetical protein
MHCPSLLHRPALLNCAGVCVGSGCKLGQLGPKTYVGVDMSNAGLQFDGVTVKPNIASYPAVMAEYFPGERDCRHPQQHAPGRHKPHAVHKPHAISF